MAVVAMNKKQQRNTFEGKSRQVKFADSFVLQNDLNIRFQ
jgi:hypothetical protein